MSTLAANNLTLLDWAKTRDPNGKTARIVELLSQANDIVSDMTWKEGNLPTGSRVTVRTSLPTVTWRQLNQGVTPSKSTSAQFDEQCAILEAWSEVDCALAKLEADMAAFRLSEASAFLEAMTQEFAGTVFYGNAGTAPEEFNGLATRYSVTTGTNGQNIISGGGSGSDNTSIWLICWGDQTLHGIFPKGSAAGLQHMDHGEVTAEVTAGLSGTRLRVFQDQFTWSCGIVVKDWRYAVRICNIDVSNLVAESSATDLYKKMIMAIHRIPFPGMGRMAFYMGRTAHEMLDIQTRDAVQTGGQLTYNDVGGRPVMTFRGIPVRKCDQILETEATVS